MYNERPRSCRAILYYYVKFVQIISHVRQYYIYCYMIYYYIINNFYVYIYINFVFLALNLGIIRREFAIRRTKIEISQSNK